MKYKLLTPLLALAVAGSLNAADADSSSPVDSSSQETKSKSQSKSGIPLPPGQQQVLFKANQLIGKSAKTPQGQDLGKIQEIVFHPDVGIYGVLKASGDKLVPVPWSLVTAVTDSDVVMNTSPQTLASAPSVTNKDWSQFNTPQFTKQIDSHYKQGSQSALGGSSSPGGSQSASGSSVSDEDDTKSSTDTESTSETDDDSSDSSSSSSSTNSPSTEK